MANKDVAQLKEGPVGPFHFYWNKQSAVWQVTATSLRALKFFRIGSVGDRMVDGEKCECRVFSNEPRLVKRVLAKINQMAEDVAFLQALEIPTLSGLTLGITDDGWLWIDGPRIDLYRDAVKFPMKRDPDKSWRGHPNRCYVAAANVEQVLADLEVVSGDVARVFDVEPPQEWWTEDSRNCSFHQNRDSGVWTIKGRLVLALNHDNGYSQAGNTTNNSKNELCVKPENILVVVEDLRAAAESRRDRREQVEFQEKVQICAPLLCAFQDGCASLTSQVFDRNFQRVGPEQYQLILEDDWLVLRTPLSASAPSEFYAQGWFWQREERAWIADLIRWEKEVISERLLYVIKRCFPKMDEKNTPTQFDDEPDFIDGDDETTTKPTWTAEALLRPSMASMPDRQSPEFSSPLRGFVNLFRAWIEDSREETEDLLRRLERQKLFIRDQDSYFTFAQHVAREHYLPWVRDDLTRLQQCQLGYFARSQLEAYRGSIHALEWVAQSERSSVRTDDWVNLISPHYLECRADGEWNFDTPDRVYDDYIWKARAMPLVALARAFQEKGQSVLFSEDEDENVWHGRCAKFLWNYLKGVVHSDMATAESPDRFLNWESRLPVKWGEHLHAMEGALVGLSCRQELALDGKPRYRRKPMAGPSI